MLKLTVPFKEKEEVIPLIDAGASELYCSYLSGEWVKKFTALEFERKGGGSNFTDLGLLKGAVDLAHKKNVPVYLALNGLYVQAQYPLLLKIIRQLGRIDIDGYIVADIGLLLKLREIGFKKEIHISTGGTAFNSQAARFYGDLGACRIVLDRHISLDEIRCLSLKNPDIDFEVFIINTLCVHIDGFCTFLHTYGRQNLGDIRQQGWKSDDKLVVESSYDPLAVSDACLLKYSVSVHNPGMRKMAHPGRIRPTLYKGLIDGCECAACAIYDLARTKIKSIKIVGRQLSPQKRLLDTRFIATVLGLLSSGCGRSRRDFIFAVQKLYRQTYNYDQPCRGNNCYHPQVLEGL